MPTTTAPNLTLVASVAGGVTGLVTAPNLTLAASVAGPLVVLTTAPNLTLTGLVGGTALLPAGLTTSGPSVTFQATTDGTFTWPASTGAVVWRAVLVDKAGNTLAQLPTAGPTATVIGPIIEGLNQIESVDLKIHADSPAAAVIEATPVKPSMEVQVYRNDRLVFFGPIVDPKPGDTHSWDTACRGAWWHQTRRHVGQLGGLLGGYGNGPQGPRNLQFDAGLAGWSTLRTVSYGDFPGFGTVDPSMVSVVTTPSFGGATQCVKFNTPFGNPDDGIQLFQDLSIIAPPKRPMTVRFSGYWWINPGDNYAPTTQRFALLLAKLPVNPGLPAGYYTQIFDTSASILANDIVRGQPIYHETSIQFPAGATGTLHMALCPPQGVSYCSGLELRADDGLDYIQWEPGAIAGNLALHGQDPNFAKINVNIDVINQPTGKLVDRIYVYEDHQNIANAVDQLARDGYFDWSVIVTPKKRTFAAWTPRKGSFKPGCRVVMGADGRGNVVSVKRSGSWSSASTAVAAQASTKGGRHDVGAFLAGATITLEEVFTADRDSRPADLPGRARDHLQGAAHPDVVEFRCLPGDERFMVGLAVGDTIPVNSDAPMNVVHGTFRVVKKETDPVNDTALFTLNTAPA